jgi:hypothetical protein
MTKREYLAKLMTMPADWIGASAADPSRYMTKTHVALHHIALRRLAPQAAPFVDVSTVTEYGLTQKLSSVIRVF